MDEAAAKRLKALEKENSELRKMCAEAMLGLKILQLLRNCFFRLGFLEAQEPG
jgi:hypothetical protein|tara:strand:- start:167 stop:325 length:159 start_codon:yes stop_codon:yes gene_type:complete